MNCLFWLWLDVLGSSFFSSWKSHQKSRSKSCPSSYFLLIFSFLSRMLVISAGHLWPVLMRSFPNFWSLIFIIFSAHFSFFHFISNFLFLYQNFIHFFRDKSLNFAFNFKNNSYIYFKFFAFRFAFHSILFFRILEQRIQIKKHWFQVKIRAQTWGSGFPGRFRIEKY